MTLWSQKNYRKKEKNYRKCTTAPIMKNKSHYTTNLKKPVIPKKISIYKPISNSLNLLTLMMTTTPAIRFIVNSLTVSIKKGSSKQSSTKEECNWRICKESTSNKKENFKLLAKPKKKTKRRPTTTTMTKIIQKW